MTQAPAGTPIGRVVLGALAILGAMVLVTALWIRLAPIEWKYASHRRCAERVIAFVEEQQRREGRAPARREEIPIECRGGAVRYEARADGWEVYLHSGRERIATWERNARRWEYQAR